MAHITADTGSLSAALPYVSGDDETSLRDLLCRYRQLHAHIMRDQGRFDKAIEDLEQAVTLAERVGTNHLLAATLLRLGGAYYDRGDIALAQSKIDTAMGNATGASKRLDQAQSDFHTAIDRFARARNLKRIPPELNGALLLAEGNAQAYLARGNSDAIMAALSVIKQGGKVIEAEKGSFDDEFSVRVSDRRYHVTKAGALLAAGWPREALQELTDLMDLPPEGDMTRMNAYTTYLWSQAYADLGQIDAATTPAQDTLEVMKQIKSRVNVMRIAGLQGQLSLIDSKNIEVIRLGVMLNV
jgi:tetratricopeptide (TPR) repeat protein